MSEITLLNTKIPLTIPNILSLYRLLIFPVITLMIILKQEMAFAILLVISLNTDVWDGWIARRFNQKTQIGARLDSLADIGMYITALSGIIVFKMDEIGADAWLFYVFVVCYVIVIVSPLIKFGEIQSLHLYSMKIAGYFQGLFFIMLFFFGFKPIYFYFMVNISLIGFIESLVIQLLITHMRSDLKSIFWVLKDFRKNHE